MALTYHFESYSEDFSTRLDRWIKRRYVACTQGMIQKALRKRFIRINNVWKKAGTPLEAGDQIGIEIHLHQEWETLSERALQSEQRTRRKPSEEIDLRSLIVDETAEVLVLNKPSGMNVQGGTNVDFSLADALKEKGYRLVHRIDRATSGLLIVAKTLSSAIFLTEMFREHKIHKNYRAIVIGSFRRSSGMIDLPILVDGNSRVAQTRYKTVYEEKGKRWTDVELTPLTGRKHQLRIHMAKLGHPIVGDRKYDSERRTIGLLPSRELFLHAQGLTLRDRHGQEKTWTVPLPSYWPTPSEK